MAKITDLLAILEGATILGRDFIEAKIDIQDELAKMVTASERGTPDHETITELFMMWRRLGGSAGTLQGYTTAVAELKAGLQRLDARLLEL